MGHHKAKVYTTKANRARARGNMGDAQMYTAKARKATAKTERLGGGKAVSQLYMRYNAERIAKEVGANTIGYVSKLGNKTVSECSAYMERKMNDYLS